MRAWCVAFPTVDRKETTKEPTREHTTNKVQKEFVVLGTGRECLSVVLAAPRDISTSLGEGVSTLRSGSYPTIARYDMLVFLGVEIRPS